MVSIPEEEALQVLQTIVGDSLSGSIERNIAIRRCIHACRLLRWGQEESNWLSEINGYPVDEELPLYRRLVAKKQWQSKGVPIDRFALLRSIDRKSREDKGDVAEITTVNFREPLSEFIALSEKGLVQTTGETKLENEDTSRPTELERVVVVQASTVAKSLLQLEQRIFDFASSRYALLRYGNILTDEWSGRRQLVDQVLKSLGFSDHLNAIGSGLTEHNPQSSRNAIFGCRNLISDLADFLWQDPRSEYSYLPGQGPNQKLEVTQGRFANRFAAYLHQKSLRTEDRKFLKGEFERLSESLRNLIVLQNTAHGLLSIDEATSIALSTFLLIGELVMKTDMEPIFEYS